MKRVNVKIPPEVLEASRALQATNRDRLVRRERDERTRREAERQARKAQEEQARSSADPKNRGVPDVEDPPFFPLQRRGEKFKVAGAYCQIEIGGIRIYSGNRGAEAFLSVPGLPTQYSCAFPSFAMAMPGGEDRVVLTFYFDKWDYSMIELPYELGSPYYENKDGETITVVDTLIFPGLGQYTPIYWWRIPRTYPSPNSDFYFEWLSAYAFYTNERKVGGLSSRLAKRREVQNLIDSASPFIRSCVVTKDRVLVVSTPPTLVNKLQQIYPRQKPSIRIEETPVTGQVEQIEESPYFVTEQQGQFTVTERYTAITRTKIDLPPGKLESIHFDYGPDPNFYNRLLLASFGYGHLINKEPTTERRNIKNFIFSRLSAMQELRRAGRSGQDSIKAEITRANSADVSPDDRGFGTPAVFAFLARYSGEFNGTNEEPPMAVDYKYIEDNYFPNDNIKHMLAVGHQPEESEVDEKKNIFYFRPSEDYGSFQTPPIVLKRNQGQPEDMVMSAPPLIGAEKQSFNPVWDWKVVREMKIAGYRDDLILSAASSGPTAINTWDWGRPLACILELLDLGFSPAALMLTTEELEAVADATPADRFNFSSPSP